MEEYIRDKAKCKAIAIYTFNSINCDGQNRIKLSKLKDSLKLTLLHFNSLIQEEEIEKIINSADKFQRQSL